MTEPEDAALAGQVMTHLSLSDLAAQIGMGGLNVQVRESSHYTGGKYIRVHDSDDFTLERIAAGEYLVRGFEESLQHLFDVASRVSERLAVLQIRHRLELYAPSSELKYYLHHNWPQHPA